MEKPYLINHDERILFVRLILLLLLSFSGLTSLYSQDLSKKYEKTVQYYSFVTTSAWREWHELKMLRNNFPAMAPYYQKRMDEIKAQYNTLANNQINTYNPNHANAIIQRTNRHMASNAPLLEEQIRANTETSIQQKKLQQVAELLTELNRTEPNYPSDHLESPEFIAATKPFHTAFDKLKDIMEGKTPFSLKDAFYIYENTYGKGYLNYEEYSKVLNESVTFIRQWAKENRYNINQSEAAHYCIQRFMRDTLFVQAPVKKMHLPFFYDYTDYTGSQDVRNLHVTKTLATGTGQCHTLQ